MTPVQRTLLAVAAFLTFMIGSFIWFVATWNAEAEQPVSGHHTQQEHTA